MEKAELLRRVAPCSLCCHTCPAMKGGEIEQTAGRLSHYLTGYYDFNRDNLPEQWKSYADTIKAFMDQLDGFARPKCRGCRDNSHSKCCIAGCFILECTMRHCVDFCADCTEFPCKRVPESDVYSPTVIKEWLDGNNRIREIGAEAYCEESCSHSHYLPFVKENHHD